MAPSLRVARTASSARAAMLASAFALALALTLVGCTGVEPVSVADRASRDATGDSTTPSDVPSADGSEGGASCGGEAQPCCVGSVCNGALVCEVTTCRAQTTCGADSQPCCVGSSCRSGFVCTAGTCRPATACGRLSQACCSGACESGLRCLADRCEACGAVTQACCGGGACGASLACVADRCQPCGAAGQPCCGSACTAGTECMAGVCRGVDRDMDGSPAGVDCDDADPRRTPGRRELCDGIDNNCNMVADDENACGLWVHTAATGAWAAFALDAMAELGAPSPNAPATEIRLALDVESLSIAYVITDTTFHVLDVRTRRWTSSGRRDSLIPQLAGRTTLGGYTIPAGHAGANPNLEAGAILATTGVFNVEFDIAMRQWRFLSEAPVPTDWAPAANAPMYSRIRAGWLDLNNAEGWASFSPMSLCTTTATRVGPYAGVIAGSSVYFFEAGHCNRFGPPVPFTSFAPFARPGSPPLARIATTFFNNGQLVVLGTR